MWFWQAAHETVAKYDKPNDHDGPRHWEYGIALMIGKLLEITRDRRGPEAAERMAAHIEGVCNSYTRGKAQATSATQ